MQVQSIVIMPPQMSQDRSLISTLYIQLHGYSSTKALCKDVDLRCPSTQRVVDIQLRYRSFHIIRNVLIRADSNHCLVGSGSWYRFR